MCELNQNNNKGRKGTKGGLKSHTATLGSNFQNKHGSKLKERPKSALTCTKVRHRLGNRGAQEKGRYSGNGKTLKQDKDSNNKS